MKILAVDIGTGTQDILLFDTQLDIENSLKLILPSPTLRVFRKIKQATREGVDILLSGNLMGGGPSGWAAQDHIRAGYRVYATSSAACSFNDDLDVVRSMGIQIIAENEIDSLVEPVRKIHMCDFDFPAISKVFNDFGVDMSNLAAAAVSVFDHGNAPADVSDRKFRFDYLDSRIRKENRLSAFAYRSEKIPKVMTRLQSVADSACDLHVPLVVMDSAPAAILGATYDPKVRSYARKLIVNIGNLHILAFRLNESGIEGVFEHHTGMLDQKQLEELLLELAAGTISNERVFNQHGHGAFMISPEPMALRLDDFGVVVTGPRRNKLMGSRLNPYFAVPFGDMMTTGCIGLLAATADLLPELAGSIHQALENSNTSRRAPWEVE